MTNSVCSAEPVYLDHAATTPLRPGALAAMLPYLERCFANPSAPYSSGRLARTALDTARDSLADTLGCEPGEVYFTSGGTEALNIAIKGYVRANREHGNHILVSAIEHHAVLHAAEALQAEGFRVERIPVDAYGRVAVDQVAERLRPETLLVAVMHANNEVGTIQPVEQIGALCAQHNVAFLVDAVQTAGHLSLDVSQLQATFVAISAHKFGGPKGIGALVARRRWLWQPLIHGGGQEREKRAGTENVAGIVGMAAALQEAAAAQLAENQRIQTLAKRLQQGIAAIAETYLNGYPKGCLPGFVHACIARVSGESLVLNLDRAGIAAAAGSACTTGSIQVSHVLLAMGVPRSLATGALRLTLGYTSTEADVDRVLDVLPQIVERLRRVPGGSQKTR